MKSVSIAMATYNGAKFISEQLESLKKQTFSPVELIITDDNSTDATREIAAAFAKTAPFPVRIEKNEKRLGYRANFMKAAGLCKGDLIAFCDQDDIWMPHKLAACASAFDNQDVWLLYHNATVVNDVLVPFETLEAWAAPQRINPPQTLGAWKYAHGFSQIFRRSLLDFMTYWPRSIDFHYPNEPEAHDQWFFFLASNLATIVYLAEPLALYRQHGHNVFGWINTSSLRWKWTVLNGQQMESMAAFESAAICRARILESIGTNPPESLRARAATAVAGFRKQENYFRMRKEIYLCGDFMARSRKIMDLLYAHAYRSKSTWGLGNQAFIRDILRGIVFPPKHIAVLGKEQA